MPEREASRPTVKLDWQPSGRRVSVPAGTSLLVAARAAGVELVAVCGGIGLCEGCRIRAIGGGLSAVTAVERSAIGPDALKEGWRLACQASVEADATVHVPPESLTTPQRLQIEGSLSPLVADPVVQVADVRLEAPSLTDLRPDFRRLQDAVRAADGGEVTAPLSILAELPARLRDLRWSASVVVRGGRILALLPTGGRPLGFAADIGTTKLAAYLIDLPGARTLGATGRMNPQIAVGEDVISRIAYAGDDRQRLLELQASVVEALNGMAAELCGQVGRRVDDIVEAVLVGNTAMHHLVAGLPVRQLGEAPYVPVTTSAIEVGSAAIGLRFAAGAVVNFPPNIAGYVGGDHVAMLLASGIAGGQSGAVVGIDVGTNTEITVSAAGRMFSCSCASGPAFEGAHIADGMRAAPGAIERVRIVGDAVKVHTIGDQPPVGVCGSGILDAVAEMRRVGILDRHGALRVAHPAVRAAGRGLGLLLAEASVTGHQRDITVTRQDVNEIQLAKAAVRAGLEVLLQRAGVSPDEVARVVIAGAFGTYLDVASVLEIGMLPAFPHARFEQVGNAAGAGARQLLVSAAARQEAAELAERVQYVELTSEPGFPDAFARAVCF